MKFCHKAVLVKVLKSRLFVASVVGAFVCCAVLLTYYSGITPQEIFPDKKATVLTYTDTQIGGNSTILHQTLEDSLVAVDFKLGEKITIPYVGVSFDVASYSKAEWQAYNQLEIQLKFKNLKKIGVALYFDNPFQKRETEASEILCYYIVEEVPGKEKYTINLDDFRVPDWWIEVHGIKEAFSYRANLKELKNLTIGNGFSSKVGQTQALEIRGVSFSRTNEWLWWEMAIGCLLFLAVVLCLLFMSERRKQKKPELTISYQPVTQESNVLDEQYMDYINQYFANPALSLELVAHETGISQRKISNHIQEQYNVNFKTYLNRLRLHESKRLLLETTLNIGEIAYHVGFNNQSHFNRVFKAEMHENPSEYRQHNKA